MGGPRPWHGAWFVGEGGLGAGLWLSMGNSALQQRPLSCPPTRSLPYRVTG